MILMQRKMSTDKKVQQKNKCRENSSQRKKGEKSWNATEEKIDQKVENGRNKLQHKGDTRVQSSASRERGRRSQTEGDTGAWRRQLNLSKFLLTVSEMYK